MTVASLDQSNSPEKVNPGAMIALMSPVPLTSEQHVELLKSGGTDVEGLGAPAVQKYVQRGSVDATFPEIPQDSQGVKSDLETVESGAQEAGLPPSAIPHNIEITIARSDKIKIPVRRAGSAQQAELDQTKHNGHERGRQHDSLVEFS